MPSVRVSFGERTLVVPLKEGATVADLQAVALGRLGVAATADDPFMMVLTADPRAELCQEDAAADVLTDAAATIIHASALNKRQRTVRALQLKLWIDSRMR